MIKPLVLSVLFFLPEIAFGDGVARTALIGLWGSPEQCERHLIIEGGSVARSPVMIGLDWIEQNRIWCRLTWFTPQVRAGRFYVITRALCGEDTARGYWLAFDLNTSSRTTSLSLIWDETLVNGPMHRCVE